jgi:hypothetical protein
MDEMSGRLDLVRLEVEQLQASIRASDSIMFQIKGWAVTAAVSTAGVSLTLGKPGVALLGICACIAFSVIEAHRKAVQRRAILRSLEIERVLTSRPLAEAVDPKLGICGPQIAISRTTAPPDTSRWSRVGLELVRPSVVAIYAGLILLLGLVAILS